MFVCLFLFKAVSMLNAGTEKPYVSESSPPVRGPPRPSPSGTHRSSPAIPGYPGWPARGCRRQQRAGSPPSTRSANPRESRGRPGRGGAPLRGCTAPRAPRPVPPRARATGNASVTSSSAALLLPPVAPALLGQRGAALGAARAPPPRGGLSAQGGRRRLVRARPRAAHGAEGGES